MLALNPVSGGRLSSMRNWSVPGSHICARAWPPVPYWKRFLPGSQWLTKIYREISRLNVELNDEVRGVFDRMLATDAEIEEATIQHGIVDLTPEDSTRWE